MTKRQKMFREIAEAFLTPRADRDKIQFDLTGAGICNGCMYYECSGLFYTAIQVIYPFAKDMGFGGFDLWLPTRGWGAFKVEYDHIRGMFCLLMAELTDKEFEELGK